MGDQITHALVESHDSTISKVQTAIGGKFVYIFFEGKGFNCCQRLSAKEARILGMGLFDASEAVSEVPA
jgi:hypothetical protein